MPKPPRRSWATFGSIALLALLVLTGVPAARALPPVPIPQDPRDEAAAEPFFGRAATARPVSAPVVPGHPFMAPNGRSNIHGDAYQTDTYTGAGPLGRHIAVRSTFVVADCASVTFDRAGRILSICVGVQGPTLVMLDPVSLELLALLPLPLRNPATGGIFTDFSGGGYFYLDHRDRAVIPTTTREIWVVGVIETPAGPAFRVERVYQLGRSVGPTDALYSVLPDWGGRLWFATAHGVVGTVDPGTGRVRVRALTGEEIANSFAVDDTRGVFIVSDHALYRFDAGPKGQPRVSWRQPYDRGTRVKPGQVSQGSGTTPSLMGRDLVAITDNADPRMHVLVYRRGRSVKGDRRVCRVPVFAPGRGATDNSLIVTDRLMVVENNYGYDSPTATGGGASTEPGLARVDVESDGCRTVWVSPERAPSVVPKLSLRTGLIYTHTKQPDDEGTDAWYLTAIDVRTGRTVFKRLTGTGLGFNNHYAPVTLGPGGAAYVGALGGLIRLADTG
jgi:hypothetical protein